MHADRDLGVLLRVSPFAPPSERWGPLHIDGVQAEIDEDIRLIAFGLTDGGTAGLIYGFLICLVGFACVYLSIAEMASM